MALNSTNTTGCGNLTSAACVTWTGKDIPCINGVCKGASIQDIVFDLASQFCEITNVSNYDLTSLNIATEEEIPDNFIELIQLLINKSGSAEPIPLPEAKSTSIVSLDNCCEVPSYTPSICVCKTGKGDLELACDPMTLGQYVEMLDEAFCKFKSDSIEIITELKQEIYTLNTTTQEQFILVNSEISSLKQSVSEIKNKKVYSKCITSKNNRVGEQVEIGYAVERIETALCSTKKVLGNDIELYNALTKQCPALGNRTSFTDKEKEMAQLDGWKATPETLSDSINNLWMIVCDLTKGVDEKLNTAINKVTLPLPLAKLEVESCAESYFLICIEPQKYDLTVLPIGYKLEIFNYDEKTNTVVDPLTPVYSYQYSEPGKFTINTAGIEPPLDGSKKYLLKVEPIYANDEKGNPVIAEPTSIVTCVTTCKVIRKYAVHATDKPDHYEKVTCGGTDATNIYAKMKVRLTSGSGLRIVNETSNELLIPVRIRCNVEGTGDYYYEHYNFIIPVGADVSNELVYLTKENISEENDSKCKVIIRGDAPEKIQIEKLENCSEKALTTYWNEESYFDEDINCNN